MTPEKLAEIEGRNLDCFAGDAAYNADVWILKADRDALVAEVKRLTADRDEARAAIDAAITAITALQMKDAATITGLEADEQACGSFCGHGRTCHSAEAHAAHNRALSALRAIDGSGT